MRVLIYYFTVISAFLLSYNSLQATHISGASIKYKSLGSNLYYIEAAVFRDCGGASYSSFTEEVYSVCTSNSAAGWTTNIVTHLPFVAPAPAPFGGPYSAVVVGTGGNQLMAEEVSDVCDKILNPNQTPNSNCRGGAAQGYLRFKFSGTITLTPCNWWRLGFSPVCCRNTNSSNITPASSDMYVHTFINTLDFPNNSAPDFADEVKPIPSACVGKKVYYGIGTIDYDGDSLRFELTCAMKDSINCVAYNTGFSAISPAAGMVMDSATGLLSFTPASSGKRVVAFWVKEYERCTGKIKAQTLRDVQFRVEVCSNNVPRDVSGISNIKGSNYTLIDSFKLEVCNGEYITFEDTIVDIDSSATTVDTLLFNSNYDKVLQGATMNVTYINKTKAVVQWTWRASIGLNPIKIFYLVFNDNYCNYPGNGFSVFEINVRNSTNSGRDTAICLGDTARLDASGGKLYEWKAVYGDSLIYSGPNQNVWSDTTLVDTNRTMRFLPKQTTVLEVWSDLQEGCIKAQACSVRDSVKIVVADTFSTSIHMDTLICYNDSTIPIYVLPNKTALTYNYKWTPSKYLDNDTIRTPNATPLTDRSYFVTITTDSGCVSYDSMHIGVTPPFPRVIEAISSDTIICQGVTASLDLVMGYTPTSCGLTQGQCIGAVQDFNIGLSTNSNSASGSNIQMWPCPYGNNVESTRQQFLYTSTELAAAGIGKGIIQGISFYVDQVAGTTTYNQYTIKVKCTGNTIANTLESGLAQVFNPKTITIKQGWNYHAFNTGYDYDGSSGLLVEICYENGGTSQNSKVRYTTTPFASCVGVLSSIGACTSNFLSLISTNNRPNIRVSICQAPDPSAFTFKWNPSTYLNHDTLKNPLALIGDSITYQAFIEDTFKKCSGFSTSIHIDLLSLDVSSDTTVCPYDTINVNVVSRTFCPGFSRYKWTSNSATAYISNDTISNPNLMAIDSTEFYLSFNDSCGCTINDTFKINIRPLPIPIVNRTPPSCGDDNGVIQLIGSGGIAPYSYTLDGAGKALSNTSGVFGSLNNGYYTLRITDAENCFIEFRDTFTNTAPIIDSVITKELSCFKSKDGEADIYASEGIVPLSYSIDGGSNYVLGSNFNTLAAGKYSVIVQSSDFCSTKPIDITINQPDSLYAQLILSEVSCNGYADAYAHATAYGGTTPYSYLWGNGFIKDSATSLSGGADSIILTDANNCRFVKQFVIKEYPKVEIDAVNLRDISCNTYDDGNIEIIAKGGKQALFYSHNKGVTFQQFNKFEKLEPTTFYLSVKDINNCTVYDTVMLTEPSKVEITPDFDSTTICVGSCTDIMVKATGGNSSNYTYHWTPNISTTVQLQRVCPELNSTYWVYGKDDVGCVSTTRKIKVSLFDSLRIEMPVNKEICLNQSVRLPVIGTGGDGTGFIYDWSPKVGLNNPNFPNPIASPDVTTTYKVTLSDLCGSPSIEDSVTVKVRPLPQIDFEADTYEGCNPAKIIFKNTSKTPSVDCLWDFGNGVQFSNCLESGVIYRTPGVYDVTLYVSDDFGCTDSLKKESLINVLYSPVPLFNWSPRKPTTKNPDVQFEDLSYLDIKSWKWSFGSFGTSDQQHPKFTFPETYQDRYPVKLTVEGENGCLNDTVYIVEIGPEFSLFIPKAFTPNEDNVNDVFRPVGKGIDYNKYQMFIYNRWGELVYESTDYEKGWDGKDVQTGKLLKQGVYAYRFIIGDTYQEAESHEYSGNVTLIITKDIE